MVLQNQDSYVFTAFVLNLTPESVSVILYEVGVATKDFVTLQGLTKLPTMEIFATRFAITYNTLPWGNFSNVHCVKF